MNGLTRSIRVGDPNVLEIHIEPSHDPDGEQSKTWATFELVVRNMNLTEYTYGGRLHRVTWYVDDIALWLASQWDFITHEERTPTPLAQKQPWEALMDFEPNEDGSGQETVSAWSDWRYRHGLQTAADGGLLPDVFFRRQGDALEVSWGPSLPLGIPDDVRFTADPVSVFLPLDAAAETLWQALNQLAPLLDERSPQVAGQIRRELTKLQTVEAKTHRKQLLLGGRGDFGSLDAVNRSAPSLLDGQKSRLDVVEADFPLATLVRSMDPDFVGDDLEVVLSYLKAGQPSPELRETIDQVSPVMDLWLRPHANGWELGREAARVFAQRFQLNSGSEVTNVDALIRRLGIDVHGVTFQTKASGAAISLLGGTRPLILIETKNGQRSEQQRFRLMCQMYHIVSTRPSNYSAMLASDWAPSIKVQASRAFAAWTLMPEAKCRHVWRTTEGNTADRAIVVAQRFGVSRLTALNHLHDLMLVSSVDRDATAEAWTFG